MWFDIRAMKFVRGENRIGPVQTWIITSDMDTTNSCGGQHVDDLMRSRSFVSRINFHFLFDFFSNKMKRATFCCCSLRTQCNVLVYCPLSWQLRHSIHFFLFSHDIVKFFVLIRHWTETRFVSHCPFVKRFEDIYTPLPTSAFLYSTAPPATHKFEVKVRYAPNFHARAAWVLYQLFSSRIFGFGS